MIFKHTRVPAASLLYPDDNDEHDGAREHGRRRTVSAQVIELEGHLEGGGREVDGRGDRILWERPDMMSALEGGRGKADIVREVA